MFYAYNGTTYNGVVMETHNFHVLPQVASLLVQTQCMLGNSLGEGVVVAAACSNFLLVG